VKGGDSLSVITEAIVKRLRDDEFLSGKKDANGNYLPNTGLLSLMYEAYWDEATSTEKQRIVPAIYSWQDYTPMIRNDQSKVHLAFIQCAGHVADVPSLRFGSKSRRARDITRDILCFYQQDKKPETADYDYSYVEKMAERVYELFDRQPLPIPAPDESGHFTTWQTVKCRANGPIILPYEQSNRFDARLDVMQVTIQFTIQET
jgi:hypothetical protein